MLENGKNFFIQPIEKEIVKTSLLIYIHHGKASKSKTIHKPCG